MLFAAKSTPTIGTTRSDDTEWSPRTQLTYTTTTDVEARNYIIAHTRTGISVGAQIMKLGSEETYNFVVDLCGMFQ